MIKTWTAEVSAGALEGDQARLQAGSEALRRYIEELVAKRRAALTSSIHRKFKLAMRRPNRACGTVTALCRLMALRIPSGKTCSAKCC